MIRIKSTNLHEIKNSCAHGNLFWEEDSISQEADTLILKAGNGKPPSKFGIDETSPEFVALHNITKRIKPLMKASIVDGIEIFRRRINLYDLADAIDLADPQLAFETVPWGSFSGSVEGLEAVVDMGVRESAQASKFLYRSAIKQLLNVEPEVAFTASNPMVERYIKEKTGELIQYISSTTQDSVRDIVQNGIERGIPPRKAAKRIKDVVGLHPRQAQALANREIKLIGEGLKGARLERALEDYRVKLLNYRAEMIARTEASFINNHGLMEVIEQNLTEIDIAGQIPAKQWIVTPYDRVCQICRPMDRRIVRLRENFNVSGSMIPHAPAHPNCNCGWALVFVSEKEITDGVKYD